MKPNLTNHIKAGFAGIYIVSNEEQRVQNDMTKVAADTGFGLFAWSITTGIVNALAGEEISETQDPMAALGATMEDTIPEQSIVLFRDFHMLLADSNPLLVRKLKDALLHAQRTNKRLVIVGCRYVLPPELEKEFTLFEFDLPDRETLRKVLDEVVQSANESGCRVTLNGNVDPLLDAASGLTTKEASDAFSLSVVERRDICPDIVAGVKASTVRKNGLLEIVDVPTGLDDIGGLANLKQDLFEKRSLFTKAAREYGIPTPRGVLIVGQPGTGKSLTASATSNIFGIPLLRLEAGKLFGSLVGQSEQNWRTAFGTARAIRPCVLWIDEVDGLFCGAASSGHTDGGTTNRIIKAILQDMQFNSEGIFFVFTANDIDNLPDPLIDRLDVWSVELPTASEREAIWKIHIAKRGRDPKKFDLTVLTQASDGYSGRQIEQVWLKAMTLAFNDGGREPKLSDVLEASRRFTPTSVTMADAIRKRRERLANKAMPASQPEPKPSGKRKLALN